MPELIYTIKGASDLDSFRQEAKKANQVYDQAFGKTAATTQKGTQAIKGQENALKELRRELRRRINVMDAELRLGEITQEQAIERVKTIKQEMAAQGAFNKQTLVGAQNFKTLATAQVRAETNFTGLGSVINRGNQVLFDFNQGLQDLPYGMRGVGNNIPFVIEGFRRFGKAAREEGISPLKAFLMALRSPAGMIGTAAAVIPTLIVFGQNFGWFGDKVESSTEKLDRFFSRLSSIANEVPGISDGVLGARLTGEFDRQVELLEKRDALIAQALSDSPWGTYADQVAVVNEEIEKQGAFLADLNDKDLEALGERIDSLGQEARLRESINRLIEENLTAREREIRDMKQATDRVLTNYNQKIGDDARDALEAHTEELEGLRGQLRESITSQIAYIETLDETSERYRTANGDLDALYERLKLVQEQVDRTNASLAERPDRPFVGMDRPEDEFDFDDRDLGTQDAERRFEQRSRQEDSEFRRMAASRAKFRLEQERAQMQMEQHILANQYTLMERRVQLDQQLQNEITAINNNGLLTRFEKEQQVWEARRANLQDTLQFEREVAQERQQVEASLQQTKQNLQQETFNALTSLSQGYAAEDKRLATTILLAEKGLAAGLVIVEGLQKAGRANMLASYYAAMVPLNPAYAAAAANAKAQAGAIYRTTALTVAAIAATTLGEAQNIANRGSRSGGTSAGGGQMTFQSGFVENEMEGSPTNVAGPRASSAIYVNIQTQADDRVISAKAERGRKLRERDMVTVNQSAVS